MNLVISGYGKMGQTIEKIILEKGWPAPLTTNRVESLSPALASQSICVDFSTPTAFRNNYRFLARHFQGVVVGTTGWDDIREDVFACFQEHNTPLIYASNFSIGVNLLFEITQELCQHLQHLHGYQASLKEVHHVHKKDAPSGTAKTLQNLIQQTIQQTVPIESIREGEVPGTHELTLESSSDCIRLSHQAYSREGFAQGAVWALEQLPHLSGIHEFRSLLFQQG